jgi:phosphate uptake regulator
LRRSLRSKDLRQRIERLRQDINALVTRLLDRLPRGLTRRRPIKARRERNQFMIVRELAPRAHASDSS